MENFPRQSWTYMKLIKRRAAEFGDRVFCSFADGDELTFAEFETATNALASGLADLSVKKADRVLGMMYNSKAFLLTMIAVQKLGATFVPVNTVIKGVFLEHQSRIELYSGALPPATIQAFTSSSPPAPSSLTPITQLSATSGCPLMTCSTSKAEMFSPRRRIESFIRSM